MIMREYGRHIQKMVDYLLTLDDKEVRQRNAQALIELMGFLNPHLKNVEDFRHKLWDHLFLISDFKLDVESPYPIPTRETLKAKPHRLPYPKRYPRFNHLGKNIEVVIDKALKEENPEKKQGFANAVAYYMKLAYSNWHKELVHDDAIRIELNSITGGALEFSNTPYIKHRNPGFERDDYHSGNTGVRRQNFTNRNPRDSRDARDSRDVRGSRDPRDSRNNNNNRSSSDNRSSNNRDNRSSNNTGRTPNFKKRF